MRRTQLEEEQACRSRGEVLVEVGEELVINGASLSEHGNWPYSAEELSLTSCYRVYWVGQQRKDYFAI